MRLIESSLDRSAVAELGNALNVHSVTARCLLGRGISDADAAREFLRPSLASLRPPKGLSGLEEALARLLVAVQKRETVGIFGDYDVDGVTTAALLSEALEAFGAKTICRVANRQEGYGFTVQGAKELVEKGCSVIIVGDCGTSDIAAIVEARNADVPVIVIDHHTVPPEGGEHPAFALINPHRQDSEFPFRHMASVGLAFYVMGALRAELRALGHFGDERAEPNVWEWLDLVALGTVADLVPLHRENRILATKGIERLAHRQRPGIVALLEMTNVSSRDAIDEQTIAWKLAPRLNAPGRLGDASASLELLLAKDMLSARTYAQMIETVNNERRSLQEEVYAAALAQIGDIEPGPAVVVAGDGWPHGVVGIIAARLVERFCRPAFVIGIDQTLKEGRGSARSYGGWNLYDVLASCGEHLERFGGHAAAAGFTVASDQIDGLRSAIHRALQDQRTEEVLLSCDAEIELDEVDESLAHELRTLSPFGKGNEEPLLVSRNVEVTQSACVGDGSHLKLTLRDKNGRDISAIAFGLAEHDPGIGARIDVAYRPQISTWSGQARLEFAVKRIWSEV